MKPRASIPAVRIAFSFYCLTAALIIVGCAPPKKTLNKHSEDAVKNPTNEINALQEALTVIPGYEPSGPKNPVLDKLDPALDSAWVTEVFNEEAGSQLNDLADLLEAGAPIPAGIIDPMARLSEVRPSNLQVVFEDSLVRVSRGTHTIANSHPNQLSESFSAWPDSGERRVKFKIIRLEKNTDTVHTDVMFQAALVGPEGRVQQSARWLCDWSLASPPVISRIEMRDYEEITRVAPSGLRFSDKTAALLGDEPSFHDQLQRGADHWRDRLQIDYGTDVNGLQGVAIGDANGDGLDDLYLCQPGGLPNRFYLRQPNGQLKDFSAEAGVDWMELTRAALFVDLDNDGDQDLVLSQDSYYMLMENTGDTRFVKRIETRSPAKLRSTAAADVDNDGDLDVFFCGRNPDSNSLNPEEGVLGFPVPYHDANNGGPNVMLINEGQWKFTDKTQELGLDENNRRFSFACAWEDFDNDGDQDLYVANDFGRNNLYRNDLNSRGRFVDVAAELGVEDISAGMSVSWGDVDRDGRMDAYVSNMFSSAGNRIAYQRQFRQGNDEALDSYRRHARGNTLFLNRSAGFEDHSESAGVTMGRWAWGSVFADFNNDGWEDIYVANGFITTPETGDL